MKRTWIWTAVMMILVFLAGCAANPQVTVLEGEERDQWIETAAPIAENLFQSINQKDYTAASRDFDEAMKKGMDEKGFNNLTAMFEEKVGTYQSFEVQKVELVDDLVIVHYRAKFEKDDAVTTRLVLRPGDPVQVTGLWFDSPKLRQ